MSERGVLDSIGDGITVRRGYGVSLDLFEGPLDLLLFLVKRDDENRKTGDQVFWL